MVVNKKRILWISICIILVVLGVYLWYSYSNKHHDAPKVEQPATAAIKTTVKVVPKESPTDNDLEVTQVYRANVNGNQVNIPVVNKENSKGVIKQEVDLSAVTQLQRKVDEREFKKNWEIGTGVGVHEGDIYIPVEIQRNYKPDRAIAVEVHMSPEIPPRVNGGEVKWIKKF